MPYLLHPTQPHSTAWQHPWHRRDEQSSLSLKGVTRVTESLLRMAVRSLCGTTGSQCTMEELALAAH